MTQEASPLSFINRVTAPDPLIISPLLPPPSSFFHLQRFEMERGSSSRRARSSEQEVNGPPAARRRTEERVFGGTGHRLSTGGISMVGCDQGQRAAPVAPPATLEEEMERLFVVETVVAALEEEGALACSQREAANR